MKDVAIAILAGGQSRRMGSEKSFISLQGKPMIEHVLDRVKTLRLPIMLITNSPDQYAKYELPMASDILPDQGSLGGLYTAIHFSRAEHTLCVACDMPFLNPALLEYLIEQLPGWDAVVPRIGGFPEAIHAIYSKACLDPIRAQILKEQLRSSGIFDSIKTHYIEEPAIKTFDPDFRSFINVNTPDDLAAIQHLE
jgi:molybdenum cofactor guanylyltransferase